MGPRAIWRDLRRGMRGAVALRRYLHSQDTIDLALGLFEAASPTATVGQPCRYVIRVANVSEKACSVNVVFQVAPMMVEPEPAPPLVRFSKHCIVPPCRPTVIECRYDWQTMAVFTVGQSSSPPDESWQRELKIPQRYVVSALLSDLTGRYLDRLDIYQELQR